VSDSGISTPRPQPQPTEASGAQGPWYARNRTAAAIVVALIVFAAAAAVVWFLRSSDSSSTPEPAPGSANTTAASGGNTAPGIRAQVVSLAKLRELAGQASHPVFWAGPRLGSRLEFTQTTDGSTFIRYLTGSAKAGVQRARYVVVATYSQPDAYARVTKIARNSNYSVRTLPDGTVAVTKPGRPQNMYLVSRGKPYQVEVFAPTVAQTRSLVLGGAITPVP
jgi:hypothetical protein